MCNECRHIMPNGRKCHSPALLGQPYCYFHTRLHLVAAAPPRAPGDPLKLPILEDRSAIQIALAQILDALGSAQLDPRRAGLFLYSLQIASQNVERDEDIIPITAVHSVTHTAGGDELGPEKSTCPYPFDCSTCDVLDGCPDYDPEGDEEDGEED
ncbi:MAG: hypothetical protein ABSG62_11080 [Terracidiphilus sp.]|jgi:hypothetical protein